MKYTPGIAVAEMSGSLGGTTASRNRGGQYFRRRAIPTRVTSTYAQNAKAILAAASQGWRALTAAQRAEWEAFSKQHPIVDALGKSFTKSGQQAYVAIRCRLAQASAALITAPPISAAPAPLLTFTQTYDIGAGAFAGTYTATPLGAGVKLWIRAAVVDSPGVAFIRNKLKFVGLSAAAQASPFDQQALIEARFGTLLVGQNVFIEMATFDTATGLMSPPRMVNGTVIST